MKYLLSSVMILFTCSTSLAAELTPGNIVGRYNVEARAGFQKVYLKFRVLNTREFEIQRTYPDGHSDESCNGTFTLNPTLYWDFVTFGSGKIFSGVATCPSNRSKELDFNIDFKETTTEDLVRGTNVTVTTSLARGIRINAYVKKQ